MIVFKYWTAGHSAVEDSTGKSLGYIRRHGSRDEGYTYTAYDATNRELYSGPDLAEAQAQYTEGLPPA